MCEHHFGTHCYLLPAAHMAPPLPFAPCAATSCCVGWLIWGCCRLLLTCLAVNIAKGFPLHACPGKWQSLFGCCSPVRAVVSPSRWLQAIISKRLPQQDLAGGADRGGCEVLTSTMGLDCNCRHCQLLWLCFFMGMLLVPVCGLCLLGAPSYRPPRSLSML